MSDDITDSLYEMKESHVDLGGDDIYTGEEPPEKDNFFKEKVPPKVLKERYSGENFLAYGAVAAGTLLVSRKIDPPVGRCLQLEAPLLGQKIDAVIAGTFLDRLLQPLFKSSEAFEDLGALLALPALVGLMERKPEWTPILMEPLSQSLGSVLEQAAPLIRKRKTKQRSYARSMSDISDAFDIPRGADPIEAILRGFIFQDMQAPEPQEEPVPAGV
jgi:hypothetical protein